jgi:hypothetical protein
MRWVGEPHAMGGLRVGGLWRGHVGGRGLDEMFPEGKTNGVDDGALTIQSGLRLGLKRSRL